MGQNQTSIRSYFHEYIQNNSVLRKLYFLNFLLLSAKHNAKQLIGRMRNKEAILLHVEWEKKYSEYWMDWCECLKSCCFHLLMGIGVKLTLSIEEVVWKSVSFENQKSLDNSSKNLSVIKKSLQKACPNFSSTFPPS